MISNSLAFRKRHSDCPLLTNSELEELDDTGFQELRPAEVMILNNNTYNIVIMVNVMPPGITINTV